MAMTMTTVQAKRKSDDLERQERMLMTKKDGLNRKLQMVKTRAQENDPLQDLERKLDGIREVSPNIKDILHYQHDIVGWPGVILSSQWSSRI